MNDVLSWNCACQKSLISGTISAREGARGAHIESIRVLGLRGRTPWRTAPWWRWAELRPRCETFLNLPGLLALLHVKTKNNKNQKIRKKEKQKKKGKNKRVKIRSKKEPRASWVNSAAKRSKQEPRTSWVTTAKRKGKQEWQDHQKLRCCGCCFGACLLPMPALLALLLVFSMTRCYGLPRASQRCAMVSQHSAGSSRRMLCG